MHVEVHTDNHITGTEHLFDQVTGVVSAALERYDRQLTRVDVYLADENGDKHGPDDKSCRIEAKPAGHQAVAAGHKAADLMDALDGAVVKLEKVLDHTFGRLDHRKGGMSYGGDQTI